MIHPPCAQKFLALLLVLGATPARAADPVAGEAAYKAQCGLCHPIVPNKNLAGPSLFGIVGRPSGSVAGFRYSAANAGAHVTWTAETLDAFLKAPREAMPGTTMLYAGLRDDARRADLIAYLETLR